MKSNELYMSVSTSNMARNRIPVDENCKILLFAIRNLLFLICREIIMKSNLWPMQMFRAGGVARPKQNVRLYQIIILM